MFNWTGLRSSIITYNWQNFHMHTNTWLGFSLWESTLSRQELVKFSRCFWVRVSNLEPHRWRGPFYLNAVNNIRPDLDWSMTVPILRIGPHLYFMFGSEAFVFSFIDCSCDCLNLTIVEIRDHAEQGSPARPLPGSIMRPAATFINNVYTVKCTQ